MRSESGLGRSTLISVLLHVALGLLLWFAAHVSVQTEPAPVSVELWAAAPPVSAVVEPTPVKRPEVARIQPVPAVPKADIKLGKKPELQKREASQPKPAILLKSVPSPEPKQKNAPKPAAPKPEPKPPSPHNRQPAKRHSNDSDDLLAELGSSQTTRKPNARVNQAGAVGGVAGGVPEGSRQAHDNYAAKVRAKILPLVQTPPGIQGNPQAVVQVVLFPTLEVQKVTLLQSSGNAAYDEAVQRAIREAGTFPSLPAGTRFSDVRQLTLKFRPH